MKQLENEQPTHIKQIWIKCNIGEIQKKLLSHFDIHLDQIILMTTLHKIISLSLSNLITRGHSTGNKCLFCFSSRSN